ncbi:acyltransferase [Sphingomonas sp. PB2P12]|uniref:acyltransferase family protein n=1 Tax=Sphingomonas sandaracina TaxID=3096157 RepID=UPI002FC6332E
MSETQTRTGSTGANPTKVRVLDPNLSIYLDLLRLVAAFEVVLGHARHFVMPRLPGFISGHTGEAVAVFFVLSGFVIAFVAEEKEHSLRAYATARLSRLYSVCLIALAAGFVCDMITRRYGVVPLTDHPFYDPAYLTNLPFALTFTNELWFSHRVFGSNEPYWSLGFEAAYYVIFAAFFYLGRVRGAVIGLMLMVAFGPKVVAYMPIWVFGLLAYRYIRAGRVTITKRLALAAFVATILAYFVVKRMLEHWAWPMYDEADLAQLVKSFVYFALVGGLVTVNIVAFRRATEGRTIFPAQLASAIRWLAGASFTLYLVHQPFFVMVASVFPKLRASPFGGPAAIVAAVILALLIAEVSERRKRVFQRAFGRLLGTTSPRPATGAR